MDNKLKQVLVVDDEEELLWTLAELFQNVEDYVQSTYASSAEEAITHIAKQKYDLLITDIQMPGLDGVQLLMEVKKVYPDTRVIVMTGYGSEELGKQVTSKGAVHYVEKPFNFKNFLELALDTIKEDEENQQVGFSGNLAGIELVDIVQMLCMTNASRKISISFEYSLEEAHIYIQDGNVIHTEYKDLQGEDAFINVFALDSGVFSVHQLDHVPKQTITKNWNSLILATMQEIDEDDKLSEKGKDYKTVFSTIEDIENYIVIPKDNEDIQDDASEPDSEVSKLTSFTATVSQQLGKLLGIGKMSAVTVEYGEKQNMLIVESDTHNELISLLIKPGSSVHDTKEQILDKLER